MDDRWFGKALASGKLKVTAALLSALGVTAFNSCGLYYPPPALYMPGPTHLLSGRATSAATASPVAGIGITATSAAVPGSILGIAVTGPDGSYDMAISHDPEGYVVSAEDPDGAENGGDFATDRKEISREEVQADEDGAFTVDFSLSPKGE